MTVSVWPVSILYLPCEPFETKFVEDWNASLDVL